MARLRSSARGPLLVVLATATLSLSSCKREQVAPDPAKTEPGPASTVRNPRTDSSSPTVPVPVETKTEERGPWPTKEGETKELFVVGLRTLTWAPGAQRASEFDVRTMTEKGGAKKLVVTQGGFTFTQKKPGRDAPLVLDTKTLTGGAVSAAHSISRLEGVWPDVLFAQASFETFLGARQFSSSNGSYERAEGKWQKITALPAALAAFDDAVLALQEGKLSVFRGTLAQAPTQAAPPAGTTCPEGAPHVIAQALDARSGAGLLLAGTTCKGALFAVERFAPGQTKGVVEELPDAPRSEAGKGYRLGVSVGSPKNLAVWTSGAATTDYLALSQGGPFRAVPLPFSAQILGATATADDALFVLVRPANKRPASDTLLRFVDGVWTRFNAPANETETSGLRTVFATDRDTALVGTALSARSNTAAALLATYDATLIGAPTDLRIVFELDKFKPTAATATASEAPAAPAAPTPLFPTYTDSCQTPFVYIFDVSGNAPADFVFPTTKKALASFAQLSDITLVEVNHQGKRRLGARVANAELGNALIAHVNATMKDEKPVLVCYVPKNERVIAVPLSRRASTAAVHRERPPLP